MFTSSFSILFGTVYIVNFIIILLYPNNLIFPHSEHFIFFFLSSSIHFLFYSIKSAEQVELFKFYFTICFKSNFLLLSQFLTFFTELFIKANFFSVKKNNHSFYR